MPGPPCSTARISRRNCRPPRNRARCRQPDFDFMSANEQLQTDYQEWRRLAEAEREAIRNQNWPAVAGCQNSLQGLQQTIARHTEEARQEWRRPGLNGAAQEKTFRAM